MHAKGNNCAKHNLVTSRSDVVVAKPRYHVPKHDQTPKMMWLPKRNPITFLSQTALRCRDDDDDDDDCSSTNLSPCCRNTGCNVLHHPAQSRARYSCDPISWRMWSRRTWS